MALRTINTIDFFEAELETALAKAEKKPLADALRETDALRKSFALEIQLLPESKRFPYAERLKLYTRRMDAVREKIARSALLEAPMDAKPVTADDVLLATKHLQNKTKKSLLQTKKTVNEARDMGTETLETLAEQEEHIRKIHAGVHDVISETKLAHDQLDSIARRMGTDKAIWCCLLLVFGVFILIVVLTQTGVVTPGAGAGPPPAPPGVTEG